MIDLKRLIQGWKEREKHGDRHGGEGNAFQVNDPPQVPVDRPPVHGNSEEGNAFQVNDHPEEKTI